MDNTRAQAERFGAELIPDDIVAVDLTGDIKTVTDSEGNVHKARAVIVTTGSQHRKLGLPNEDKLSGRGVSSGRDWRWTGPGAQGTACVPSWRPGWFGSARTATPRRPRCPSRRGSSTLRAGW